MDSIYKYIRNFKVFPHFFKKAHKKASTNILPLQILNNLHTNFKRLTHAKLFDGDNDKNKKKRTKTENTENILFFNKFKNYADIQANDPLVIDEENNNMEEMLEKRAISFVEDVYDYNKRYTIKNIRSQGYFFHDINENIIKSLKEKEPEYEDFYAKIDEKN